MNSTTGGLFDKVAVGVTIKNLVVENPVLNTGNNTVGIIAGKFGDVGGATLENCAVINAEMNAPLWAGLLVGNCDHAKIKGCFATGNITTSSGTVGGLAGGNIFGTIENSYFIGNIEASGATAIGGILGLSQGNDENDSHVRNCYTAGSINGSGSRVWRYRGPPGARPTGLTTFPTTIAL